MSARAPAADPDLEVQMGPGRRAGRADLGQVPPAADPAAPGHAERAAAQVHEDVVAAVRPAEHEVDPGAGRLLGGDGDRAAARGDDGGALGGGDVLALVDVPGARRAEAGARTSERD